MPPSKADLIRQATIDARNNWAAFAVTKEREVNTLFTNVANNLAARIEQYEVKGVVPPQYLTSMFNDVKAEEVASRLRLTSQIRSGVSGSVDLGIEGGIRQSAVAAPPRARIGIGTSYIDQGGRMRRYDPAKEIYQASAWGRMNAGAVEAVLKWAPGGEILSSRVWDISNAMSKQIRNRLQMGVIGGESAASMTRDLRGMLSAEAKSLPYRRVRNAAGRLVPSRAMTAVQNARRAAGVSGRGLYYSPQANALRLVRTEMSRAYNEGFIRYAMQKSWVIGFRWRTASGEPCPICQSLEGAFFPKENPPALPEHPNCYCYLEEVTEANKAEKIGGVKEHRHCTCINHGSWD